MAIIRLRRDTAANWTTQNPVLALGEPGVETDTQKIKIGDGSTAWSSLPYTASSGSGTAGASAYEVAVANGFVGNEAAWLASLVGADGAPGAPGNDGAPGAPGNDGAPGVGVPTGGTTGQVLAKVDNTDYNTQWVDQTGGGVTSYNDLNDKPFIPTSLSDFGITAGSNGQVLTLNSSLTPVWATPSGGGGGSPTNEITNTDGSNTYSVSVGTDGVISMTTARGGIEFGAMPEVGSPQHLHIMRPAMQESSTDLYFGDDYNYVKLPGMYPPNMQQGVEIGSSVNQGPVSVWRFGDNGSLIPPTATIPALAWQDSFTHPTLELGTNTDNVAISDTVSDDMNRGNRHIRIIGQKGYGTNSTSGNGGKGTSIDIYGGLGGESSEWNMGGEGGTINIQGGTGQHGGLGGWVNITGGKATENNAGNNPATVYGGQVNITGGAAIDGLVPGQGIGGDVILQGGQGNQLNGRVSVQTYDSVNTAWNIWHFRPDSTLELPSSSSVQQNSSWTRTLDASVSDTGIIWTAIQSNVSSVKLTIQLEVEETGDSTGWHSQIADAVIASRGFATSFSGPGGEPAMTVFGVTHTSIQPLAIFSVQRNPLTKNIEVVATKTAAGNSGSVMYFKIHSVEMATRN